MTSIVLGDMVARKKGLIINLSSAAGKEPVPLLSVYSACKVSISISIVLKTCVFPLHALIKERSKTIYTTIFITPVFSAC